MSKTWESESVKAQIRLTGLRLGQLQESKDAQAISARRDIATLLQQHDIRAARIKARKLIQDDSLGDLLEKLGMYLGFLLEHLKEIDTVLPLSSNLIEAASTIIFAAPHAASEDLNVVRDLLVEHLGEEFASTTHLNKRVSPAVVCAVNVPPPSASVINACMKQVANDHAIKWSPEPERDEILEKVAEIIDPQISPVVDLPNLRLLCRHGLPDGLQPLRPRIWKLFMGTLPVLKTHWGSYLQKQRHSYYDLVQQFLEPFCHLPPPTKPLAHIDAVLLDVSRQLADVTLVLFSGILQSDACPLSYAMEMPSARNLDLRLMALQSHSDFQPRAGISVPDISGRAPLLDQDSESQDGLRKLPHALPKLLSEQHLSALSRLLYVHTRINPGNFSPHMSSLLVLLYVVLNQETQPEEQVHMEADTFWLFEAVVGEFSELEDQDGGNVWMKKFSERLAWADIELFRDLQAKGLDPALPHYSYQWLAPLLTHTLPVSSVIIAWDAILSFPVRERNSNPKIDFLLDIGSAMLICAKPGLVSQGKMASNSWGRPDNAGIRPGPLPAWQLREAFIEGLSFLRRYPLEAVGGIDVILQLALDLKHQREYQNTQNQAEPLSFGARLGVALWKGFTNQPPSPESSPETSPEVSDEEPAPKTPPKQDNDDDEDIRSRRRTSVWAKSVWNGLKKHSSMDVLITPISPYTPTKSPLYAAQENALTNDTISGSNSPANFWGYAGKLRNSNALAMVSKVGSNWNTKNLLSPWSTSSASLNVDRSTSPSVSVRDRDRDLDDMQDRTLSITDNGQTYSLPPRPAHFRPPRDSFIMASPDEPRQIDDNLLGSFQTSLASLARGATSPSPAAVKSVPRPLLLGAASPSRAASRGTVSLSGQGEWAEVLKLKKHVIHGSQSSASSLSPSDAYRPIPDRKDWDSDGGNAGSSRRVPLNRRSVSPMALASKLQQGRHISGSSMSSGGPLSPPLSSAFDKKSSPLRTIDSPPLLMSPHFSLSNFPETGIIHLGNSDDMTDDLLESKKSTQAPSPSSSLSPAEKPPTSPVPKDRSRSPRLRSKHQTFRPPALNIQDIDTKSQALVIERKPSNPNALDVEKPSDDQGVTMTPRASTFKVDEELSSTPPKLSKPFRRPRKTSPSETTRKGLGDSSDTRVRRPSTGQRVRKSSGESDKWSSADEGDDEGYDDLLSAYESESSQASSSR